MARDEVFTIYEDIRAIALGIDPKDESPPEGYIISLMAMGLPINAKDFRDPWTSSGGGSTDVVVAKARQQSLYNLSRLVDGKLALDGSGRVIAGSTPISDTWKVVIDAAQSKRGPSEPDPVMTARVEEAQKKLYRERDEVVEKTPIYRAYDQRRIAYEQAKSNYTNAYLAAAETPAGIEAWPMTGQIHLARIQQAREEWETLGHKEQVEGWLNTIAAQGKDAIEAVISLAKRSYDPWQLALGQVGVTTPYVQVTPSNWAEANAEDDGWLEYGYSRRRRRTEHRDETTSWGGSVSVGWGFWRVGGGAGSTERKVHDEFETDDLAIEFKLGVVDIDRPWLRAVLLNVSGWAIPGQDKHVVSDGTAAQARPDTDEVFWLPNLPKKMILIKDLRIRNGKIQDVYDSLKSSLSAGASVGWGPFAIGGSYSRDFYEVKTDFELEDGFLKIRGVQLVGWVSEILPASPTVNGR